MSTNPKSLFTLPTCILLATWWIASTGHAHDIKPGDRVTVIHWDAEFKADNVVVDRCGVGRNFTVAKVNGDWLWIKAWKGYLNVSDVVPYEQAIDHFTTLIHRDPNSSSAYYDRAIMWQARGEHDIAIGDFSEAIKLNPKSSVAYLERGDSWRAKGDLDRAIADCSEAIRLNPSSPNAYSSRASAWEDKREFGKSIADIGEAIRLDSRSENTLCQRARFYIKQYDYDHAARDLVEVIKLNPKSWDAYHTFSILHSSRRDWRGAVEANTKCLELDDATVANSRRSMANLRMGNFEEALADLLIAGRDENSWDALFEGKLAQIKAGCGDFDEALQKFNRILESPDAGRIWHRVAFAKFLSSCPDAKFRNGPRALKLVLETKDTPSDSVDLREAMAAAYAECGNFEQAIACQKNAIELAVRQRMHESYIRILQDCLTLFESHKPYRFTVQSKRSGTTP